MKLILLVLFSFSAVGISETHRDSASAARPLQSAELTRWCNENRENLKNWHEVSLSLRHNEVEAMNYSIASFDGKKTHVVEDIGTPVTASIQIDAKARNYWQNE